MAVRAQISTDTPSTRQIHEFCEFFWGGVTFRRQFPLYGVRKKSASFNLQKRLTFMGVWPRALKIETIRPRLPNCPSMFPVLFQVGHLTAYSYGVLMGFGTLLAILWTVRLAGKEGIPPARVEGLGLVIVLSAVIGSKLLTALDYPGFYSGDWSLLWREILDRGGVFYGGLLFALATSALYFWLNHLPGWKIADCVTPGLALAQGIARIGCFLAGCCWGTPTSLPIGVRFTSEQAHTITGVPLNVKLHPTQLYEAALVLIAIPFLLRLMKRKSFDGQVVLTYILYYAVVRFFVEYLRGDPRGLYFNGLLSTSQLISLLIIPIAGLLLVSLRKHSDIASRHDRIAPRMVRSKVRARAT